MEGGEAMIFSFAEEDRKIIIEFEKKARAQGITTEDFKREFADVELVSEDEIKIKLEDRKNDKLIALCNEFEEIGQKIEYEQLKELKTQAKIIEDAKKKAEEAIIFMYNLNSKGFRAEYNKILISGVNFGYKNLLAAIIADGAKQTFELLEEKSIENKPIIFEHEGFFYFLKEEVLKEHYARLKSAPGVRKLDKVINSILTNSRYIEHDEGGYNGNFALYKNNLPIHYGRYIPITADVTKQPQTIEPLSNEIVIESKEREYIYKLSNADNIKGLNRINTHKLFIVCVAEFTKLNNKGAKTNYTVKFPLKDYAALLGYDVLERPTENQEEAEKEKKRAAEVLKKARKAINQDLNLLYNCSYSWKEKIKGREEDYKDIRIIGAKGIEKGYIEAEITPSFANYILKHMAMTKYPQALLGIDGKHNNAYYLGLKIAEHWHIDKNQEKGTNDILSVKVLLGCLDLPNIEKIREQRASWQQRIFEPFMQALDYLKIKGFLDDYNLVKAKSGELTAQEREAAYKEYNLFENLYLKYDINEKYK